MSYILALDQGTTSSRAIIFDREGNSLAVAQKEFNQIFPQSGWVEHDPQEIWSSQVGVATEALSRAGLRPRDIAGIGITNQRETTVVWDCRTGKPIHNAIVWQDRRTAGFSDQLKEDGHEETFRNKTGLLLDSYFSGTKVRWILDNVDGARPKAEAGHLAFGTIDSWLVWNLTGGKLHITDVTNASRTLMLNIHTGEWDDELLGIFDIPRSMLPEVRSSSEIYGNTSGEIFSSQTPISGIAGDQQAATFGQRCTSRGMVKNTYGTGCFMLMHTGSEAIASKNNLLTTIAWKLGDKPIEYALEGSVFIAGAVVQWLRDGLEIIQKSSEIEGLARSVDDSGGVFLVPAFAGLGAPHWDPYARGTIVGISRGTTRAHIARAALEGIAFQVADVLEAMQKDSDIDIQELRVDGGAAENDLLMQIQADLLGSPLVRPTVTETTALGAAYLAGLAVDYWKSEEEVTELWKADKHFKPEIDQKDRKTLKCGWAKALERAKGWADD